MYLSHNTVGGQVRAEDNALYTYRVHMPLTYKTRFIFFATIFKFFRIGEWDLMSQISCDNLRVDLAAR